MSLVKELLGSMSPEVWISAIFVWIPISLFAYKLLEIIKSNRVTPSTFKIKYWLNANLFIVVFGYVLSLVILRLGDYAFAIAVKFGYEFGATEDFVAWMIPLTWFIQWSLERVKKPAVIKKVRKEMDMRNNTISLDTGGQLPPDDDDSKKQK